MMVERAGLTTSIGGHPVMIGGGRRDDGVSASHSGDMYQTVSDSRSEVAHVHKYSISGMALRPTTLNFLDASQTGEIEMRDIFEKYQREYEALSDEFHRSMSLADYCHIKWTWAQEVQQRTANIRLRD
jgi:hypothetical protein